MSFSFFRKNRDDEAKPASRSIAPAAKAGSASPVAGKPVASPVPQAAPIPATDQAAPLTEGIDACPTGANIVTGEVGSVVEESAVLYASDYADQAGMLLLEYIRNFPEANEMKPWVMLFEIWQIQGEKKQFDDLALEFVVKFERSAPIWSNQKVVGSKPKPCSSASAAEGYISFTGLLTGDKDSFFQGMLQAAKKGGGLRLDFARLEGVDMSGCRRLLDVLHELKTDDKRITLVGAAILADLLKAATGLGGEDEQAYWQLLLHLYQCQGLQAEFEDLAVEYAVTFEVSPPSWDPVSPCKAAAAELEAPSQPSAALDEDAFYLRGVIASGNEQQFEALTRFAASRTECLVDMTDVPRVDFASIGHFVNELASLSASGKKIQIRNANEMIRALFGIMGVDQFATVLRRRIG